MNAFENIRDLIDKLGAAYLATRTGKSAYGVMQPLGE
jgi:hypothetical protein